MYVVDKIEVRDEPRDTRLQDTCCIRLEDLSITYPNKTACTEVNMSIFRNRVNAIVGPSGCGKSTLIHALAGVIHIDQNCDIRGNIFVNEHNITTESDEAKRFFRTTGLIFQQPTPFPFSIYRNFSIPLKENGIKNNAEIESIMCAMLKRVGLWDEVKDRLTQSALKLSGGQQQRLCIARALALQPEILLMDEPCSALDPIATTHIESLINELKNDFTIVLVTHNLAQAKRIADYVSLFWSINDTGILVEQTTAREFFTQPNHHLSKAYINGLSG